MARYIDGTWLKAFFEADKGKGRSTPIDSLLALIDDAPTAECFTCGMERVKDEKFPTLVYHPENVPDEVLEANDRLVRLADVCKLIKSEYEMCPHIWGELTRLPQFSCDDCVWTVCNYNSVFGKVFVGEPTDVDCGWK